MFKTHSQRLLLILFALAVILVFGAAAVFFYWRASNQTPAAPTAQPAAAITATASPTVAAKTTGKISLPPPNLIVNLTKPEGAVTIKPGGRLSIHGQAVSAVTIRSLELWMDGKKIETRFPPAGQDRPFFSAIWDWTPQDAGQHEFYLRGFDKNGNSQYSNISQVTVEGPAPAEDGGPGGLPVLSAPSAGSAPAGEGTGMAAVDFFAPASGSAGEPQAVDAETTQEPAPDDPTPTPTIGIPPAQEPSDSPFNLQITAAEDGCNHVFTVKDLNNKARRFVLFEKVMGFFSTSIAADAAPEGVTLIHGDPKAVGAHEYYIRAIGIGNTAADSDIYTLNISDESCAAGYDHITVFGDVKVVPKFRTENFSCYTRFNGESWKKLPEQGFLQPMSGQAINAWKENMKLVDAAFPEPRANQVYDLLPYIPNLGAAGTNKFDFWVRCYQTKWNEDAEFFDIVAKGINMQETGKVNVLSGDKMDVYVYFSQRAVVPPPGTNNSEGFTMMVAAPKEMIAIYDPENCPFGIEKVLCQIALDNNYVLFRWKWEPQPCVSSSSVGEAICLEPPEGFFLHSLVGISSPTPTYIPFIQSEDGYYYSIMPYPGDITSDPLDPWAGVLGIRDYWTVARSGFVLSMPSNRVGVGNREGTQTIKTLTLEPVQTGRYINGVSEGESTNSYPNPNVPLPIFTGWNKETDPYESWIQYGMFRYDLSELTGKVIHSAKLDVSVNQNISWLCNEPDFTFPVALDTSTCGMPVPASGCATALTMLTRDAGNGFHSTPPQTTGALYLWEGSAVSHIDATDEVRQWVDGNLPNYGFIFDTRPSFSVTGDWEGYGCYTYYNRPVLTVEYSDR
jgi:hypothetical protein